MKSKIILLSLFILVVLSTQVLAQTHTNIQQISEPTPTPVETKAPIVIPVEAVKTTAEKIEIEIASATKLPEMTGCKNLCGDGVCQNVVCIRAEGCPCPETPESCPQDCISTQKPVPVPSIALPEAVSTRISPVETNPISIEGKPVEFKGVEKAPEVVFTVKPIAATAMAPNVVEIACKDALKTNIDICIAAGKDEKECKANYTKTVEEKCVGKPADQMATVVPQVSVKLAIDRDKKITTINVGNTTAITHEVLKFESNSLKIETPKGDIAVSVLPSVSNEVVISRENQTIVKNELKIIEDKPVYEVEAVKDAKLFWFIPVTVPITTHVSVESGEIIKVDKPWWSFLAW